MFQYEYKGFAIQRVNRHYEVYLSGNLIRICKTLKECKRRIDTQTI